MIRYEQRAALPRQILAANFFIRQLEVVIILRKRRIFISAFTICDKRNVGAAVKLMGDFINRRRSIRSLR